MKKVTLGGRRFRVADYSKRTVVMDHYMRTFIVEIGLDRCLPLPGETDAEYMARLHAKVTSSMKACGMLGGYLLPEGAKDADGAMYNVSEQTWSTQIAAETTVFLAHLSDEADRQSVDALCMDVAFAFFRHAVELLRSSPNSSLATAMTNGSTPSPPMNGSDSRPSAPP